MALTCNAAYQNDGWQTQADRLTSTHGVLGVAVMTLADKRRKVRGQSLPQPVIHCAGATGSEFEASPPKNVNRLTTELDPTRAKVAALERQLERKTKLAAKLHEHLDAWQERATIAERRIADLESELNDARATLSFQQNENCSLQTSLDLLLSENSRQSQCLAEKEAAVDHAQRELAALKTHLTAVATERDKLFATVRETRELHQAETDNLKARLASMSSDAAAAEQLLERVRRSILEKLRLIQNSTGANDRRVQELEHSLTRLIDGTSTLLTTFKARDLALATADEKIICLTERVCRLEVDTNAAKAPPGIRKSVYPHDASAPSTLMEAGAEKLVLNHPVSELKSNGNVERGDAISDAPRLGLTLLAETITF